MARWSFSFSRSRWWRRCSSQPAAARRRRSPSTDRPFVGQRSELQVTAGAPGRDVHDTSRSRSNRTARRSPLFALDQPGNGDRRQAGRRPAADHRPLGKATMPRTAAGRGPHRRWHATRPSLLNLRTLSSTTSKDIQVRLEPPRVAVLSTHHYVNHGGSEMVVYRATPADVTSGVRVGDSNTRISRPRAPASPAAPTGAEGGVLRAPARSGSRRRRSACSPGTKPATRRRRTFVDKVFPKAFKQSRIALDDASSHGSSPRFSRTRRN